LTAHYQCGIGFSETGNRLNGQTMTIKELIDAGRSSRGWSRVGTHMRCQQLFAYTERLGIKLVSAEALTRGSIGHVGHAHLHAIWGARQGGVLVNTEMVDDPTRLLSPRDAMLAWCDLEGRGHDMLDQMRSVFDRYVERNPEPPGRVVAVEWPMAAVIGYKRGEWGLWVVHPDEESRLDEERQSVVACDDETIQIDPLNMPGHPDDGKPVYVTRRVDAVIEEGDRRVIWDHKFQGWVSGKVRAYSIDGGFGLFRHMGKQVFGEKFGGVRLNLIQTTDPYKLSRPKVPQSPHRDRHLAHLLWEEEHQIARKDLDQPNYWEWPKSMHEAGPCQGQYGTCAGLDLCLYGEAGQKYLNIERGSRDR